MLRLTMRRTYHLSSRQNLQPFLNQALLKHKLDYKVEYIPSVFSVYMILDQLVTQKIQLVGEDNTL
jgi:hypothetical protein